MVIVPIALGGLFWTIVGLIILMWMISSGSDAKEAEDRRAAAETKRVEKARALSDAGLCHFCEGRGYYTVEYKHQELKEGCGSCNGTGGAGGRGISWQAREIAAAKVRRGSDSEKYKAWAAEHNAGYFAPK